MPSKKEIATTENKALAIVDDFEGHAGEGMENVGVKDVLIPRLTIIQDLSPQRKTSKAEFIAGAEVGHICDVGTGDLYKEGVVFIPVHYSKSFLEWAPRSTGKGLVNIHPTPEILDACSRDNEKKIPILPNGNLIAETAQYFGLNMTADGRKSFIPFTSSQLKRARGWMTLATGEKLVRGDGSKFTAPLWYRSYHLTTVVESNNEGEWAGWKITRGLSLPELGEEMGFNYRETMEECIEFRASLIAGDLRADIASMEGDSSSDTSDGTEGAM